MAYKDLHEEPFDEGTIVKLEIFEDYAQAWLPTFIMQGVPEVCIFDFFAGTGYDKNGIPGSPIRFLQKVKEQIGNIFQKKVKIKLYLNEYEPNKKEQKKFDLLYSACIGFLETHKDVKRAIDIQFFNEDFELLFPKLKPQIQQKPSLVYLDQNGMKFLSDTYFMELEKMRQTDFLYFLSSSYFWRFGSSKEFQSHLFIDMNAAKKDPYKFIHRNILEQLRKKLPLGSKLKLYPFSIKKVPNIYGIIFGATHPRAVDKFLKIAWKRNETNGDANFDIDEDEKNKVVIDLWGNMQKTKIEQFKENLRKEILERKIKTNKEALDYSYNCGHIPKHASDCIKKMKIDKEITYNNSSPLVSYDNVYSKQNILTYVTLK